MFYRVRAGTQLDSCKHDFNEERWSSVVWDNNSSSRRLTEYISLVWRGRIS